MATRHDQMRRAISAIVANSAGVIGPSFAASSPARRRSWRGQTPARLGGAGDCFHAIKRLAPAVLLDQHNAAELHTLERGETAAAGEAFAAAADAVLFRAGIGDLCLGLSAERAVHVRPRESRPAARAC